MNDFYEILSESKDPRKKDLPPRPSGQRPEPDRRGTGAFGQQFPFGGGNFQFSFGIGGFPFGFMGTFANFGTEQPPPVRVLSSFKDIDLNRIHFCDEFSHIGPEPKSFSERRTTKRGAASIQSLFVYWTGIHRVDFHFIDQSCFKNLILSQTTIIVSSALK